MVELVAKPVFVETHEEEEYRSLKMIEQHLSQRRRHHSQLPVQSVGSSSSWKIWNNQETRG
jgi:hypothetical protein